MHKLYGLDCFQIDFDLEPDNHTVTIIKIKTPTKVFQTTPQTKYYPQKQFKFV